MRKTLLIPIITLVVALSSFVQSSSDVIICKSSGATRYHSHVCYGMDRCKAVRDTVTIVYAKSIGRTPCKICYKSTSRSSYKSNDGRCTATTQAGTRCKRSAQSGRSKCWQH